MGQQHEEILKSLGPYSRWQMAIYVMLSLTVWVPISWRMLSIVFLGSTPPHHCESLNSNRTHLFNATQAASLVGNTSNITKCSQYPKSLSRNDCSKWWYDPSWGKTIVVEWDLVCEKSYYSAVSQVVVQTGMLIGVILAPILIGKFGRKYNFLTSTVMMSVFGAITAASVNYTMFVSMRFIAGVFRDIASTAGTALLEELFPKDQRAFAATAHQIAFGVGMVLLALFAYLIPDWRILQLVTSLVPLICVVEYFVLPESIPWLLEHERQTEAKRILYGAAQFNRDPVPHEVSELQPIEEEPIIDKNANIRNGNGKSKVEPFRDADDDQQNEEKQKLSPVEIFRDRTLLRHTIVMSFSWFTITMVYYGMAFDINNLPGNRFVNFMLSGLIEIPAYISTIFVMTFFGKAKPFFVFNIIATGCFVLDMFVDNSIVDIVLFLIARFFISANFAIMMAYAPELYPEQLRLAGITTTAVTGRAGSILAPFYNIIGKRVYWIPLAVSATVCGLNAILVLLLPETAINKLK